MIDPGYFGANPFAQNQAMNPFMAMMPQQGNPGMDPQRDPRMNQWASFYQQNFGDGGPADPGNNPPAYGLRRRQAAGQQTGNANPGNGNQGRQQQPRY